ncbi:hypothetical protein [Streptomyces albidoflavus]|uniref:hypothetical protein n=1 Tax=Streptomyces albidoflavus TaxID=1886 RepID=UPI00101FB022|nr:hypothetical protein [Streptomyces albidoflavus]RZE68138.1 hypothetical protein C0Q99_31330 [Streptomyces albidoflavus]
MTDSIDHHFGLSYANYLVLPRTLLQSMSAEWQQQFVALLHQYDEAFAHVPQAEAYEVTAAVERKVRDLDEYEARLLGITVDPCPGKEPPEGMSPEERAEWRDANWDPTYSRHGQELDSEERVMLPKADPVPHYNRGRTHIEPCATSPR